MSLVANYSDSDPSSGGTDDDVEVKAKPCAKHPIALPSADDLFSDASGAKTTSLAAFASARPTTMPSLGSKRPRDAATPAMMESSKNAKRKLVEYPKDNEASAIHSGNSDEIHRAVGDLTIIMLSACSGTPPH
ncbi:hypothetical protein H310_08989 [Aphanomyces invadans]|uniref:Uncharacterized protein n=1 Tax=Aphanomyces invadans TaxID=157072 RepID=A0A024TY42_9STRA|nr:hypothetical protein H310_08989 [Aphanomyces invadans]ETV98277.1 hypothetical protein H310_08989 [Aphanomyces invadans]|eukprot:XP_008873152.1 hypothetical protein H310_08989 [Aphanomyces invadans]